jgi:hypothetical protein
VLKINFPVYNYYASAIISPKLHYGRMAGPAPHQYGNCEHVGRPAAPRPVRDWLARSADAS